LGRESAVLEGGVEVEGPLLDKRHGVSHEGAHIEDVIVTTLQADASPYDKRGELAGFETATVKGVKKEDQDEIVGSERCLAVDDLHLGSKSSPHVDN
jgi:hypothetical protein